MAPRPRRRHISRLGAVFVAVVVAAITAGVANAGSGDPKSIHLHATASLTVSASGTWSWPEMATAGKLSYAGYAIDWGDVTSGNTVPKTGGGAYHVGDGTAATNFVLHPTSPAQGASGSWGPVSHTYAQAGIYTVCVIIYDIGEVTPFKATGYHGIRAGGDDRNTDNSVEQNNDVTGNCSTIDLAGSKASPTAAASATPEQSVAGVTAGPQRTPPPTETASDAQSTTVGFESMWALVLALIVALGVAAFFATPRRRHR